MADNNNISGSLADLHARISVLRGAGEYPPVDQWQPSRTGNSGMRIGRDGTWYFRDSPFRRPAFVRMFASILRRDGDQHFLVTPEEKLRIAVDVAPFHVTDFEALGSEALGCEELGCEVLGDGAGQQLVFATSTGDQVVLDEAHPLQVEVADDGQPVPLLEVRGGMMGLLSRNLFYRLVELAEPDARGVPGVWSSGRHWPLHSP